MGKSRGRVVRREEKAVKGEGERRWKGLGVKNRMEGRGDYVGRGEETKRWLRGVERAEGEQGKERESGKGGTS